MAKPAKAYIKDGVYIPIRFVSQDTKELLKEKYKRDLFKKEEICEDCEYYSERVNDICESCANYMGTVKLYSYQVVNDKKYLRLPFGMQRQTEEILGRDVNFVDKTPDAPMHRDPKFLAELRPDQKVCLKAMLKAEHGVLRSPPRTGKTVMGSAFVCKVKQKTLILAAQKDWLDNFYETFVGSDTQKPMTNIKGKRIGFPKTLEEFERMDVCLCTYQMFLKPKGKKLLHKIRKMFGVLLIDEVQTVGATELAAIVTQINARYKIGVSGTPERKDCVSGNTMVITDIGPREIKDIKIGDIVHTRAGLRHVVETHVRPKAKMVRIDYEGGHLECTPDHKLWSVTRKEWVAAKDLTTEDELGEFPFDKVT